MTANMLFFEVLISSDYCSLLLYSIVWEGCRAADFVEGCGTLCCVQSTYVHWHQWESMNIKITAGEIRCVMVFLSLCLTKSTKYSPSPKATYVLYLLVKCFQFCNSTWQLLPCHKTTIRLPNLKHQLASRDAKPNCLCGVIFKRDERQQPISWRKEPRNLYWWEFEDRVSYTTWNKALTTQEQL